MQPGHAGGEPGQRRRQPPGAALRPVRPVPRNRPHRVRRVFRAAACAACALTNSASAAWGDSGTGAAAASCEGPGCSCCGPRVVMGLRRWSDLSTGARAGVVAAAVQSCSHARIPHGGSVSADGGSAVMLDCRCWSCWRLMVLGKGQAAGRCRLLLFSRISCGYGLLLVKPQGLEKLLHVALLRLVPSPRRFRMSRRQSV